MRPSPRTGARAAWLAALLVTTMTPARAAGSYDDLLALWQAFRTLEQPALREGAPDYTAAAVAQRHAALQRLQARLATLDPAGWPREQQIDHALVRAQLNGMDFAVRVLEPWARDPAFYQSVWNEQSDTPEHEGPVHHAPIELWQYRFPLTREAEARLVRELGTVAPLLAQARLNLTGDARDLWTTGIATMQAQVASLDALAERTASSGAGLRRAIAAARTATVEFVGWLEAQAPSKKKPRRSSPSDAP